MLTKIKLSRMRLELTQRHVAGRLGVSGTFMSQVEAGRAKVPLTRQRQIVDLLGGEASDFFDEKTGFAKQA